MNTIRITLATAVTGTALALGAHTPASAQTRDTETTQPAHVVDIADYITQRKESWAASGPELPIHP